MPVPRPSALLGAHEEQVTPAVPSADVQSVHFGNKSDELHRLFSELNHEWQSVQELLSSVRNMLTAQHSEMHAIRNELSATRSALTVVRDELDFLRKMSGDTTEIGSAVAEISEEKARLDKVSAAWRSGYENH